MTANAARTAVDLLRQALRADPGRPLLTYYDDATGERIELSAATLDNWVSKTANLLVDGSWTDADRAAVLLPPHWQHAAVLLGCWSAGLTVVAGESAAAEVAFSTVDRHAEAVDSGADDVYVLSLHPLGAPVSDLPGGALDFATEVRAHGDHFAPTTPVTGDPRALVDADGHTRTQAELVEVAAERAAEWGLSKDDRVLVAVEDHTPVEDWLLAALSAGASTVLVRHADAGSLAGRVAAERVTVVVAEQFPEQPDGVRRVDGARSNDGA